MDELKSEPRLTGRALQRELGVTAWPTLFRFGPGFPPSGRSAPHTRYSTRPGYRWINVVGHAARRLRTPWLAIVIELYPGLVGRLDTGAVHPRVWAAGAASVGCPRANREGTVRFDVDTDHLTATAPDFAAAGAELTEAVRQLRGTLFGLGSVWGNDEQGAAFHAGYEPQAELVATAADNVARGLHTIGEGVGAMAHNHATTDAGVRSGLQSR